ncbi:hypothetical protein FOQG_09729 [Fusarium oxysporum f. sp. raphani 54005]|uniref:Zn(2)-C6 fungal-type domain-containing protein n=3 Tax=Fusarium oxysporum TaxID=5507 RepID=X0C6M1_FUSOX|nr:hypothetical protein FOQG_09729 [Fusarium oxysporum f. sp. raphani 54005]KAG7428085.1 Transcription factor vrtR1 [Fusarium oxysporum f. sp. raphani]
MRSQACEPCAKRKVKCDRAEPPCSNCKRRKHDNCTYPEVSPFERIRKLEEAVRALGGDPLSDTPQRLRGQSVKNSPAEGSIAETPIIVLEEGKSVYHESEGWHTWIDVSRLYKGSKPKFNASDPRGSALSPGKHLPHAFHGSPWRDNTILSEKLDFCPIATEEALKLWDLFMERVEPIVKISFSWTLTHLRAALSDAEKWTRLDNGDHVLILSTCLFGATSLTNQECLDLFGRTKASLTNECRVQCDMAFSRISLLAIDSISTLKAMCLYIKANVDVLTSRSMWTLMGLISRSAEQLGMHRDGTVLGLSPIETEDRRRLWWQLQHLDLILSLKNNVTPLSFGAGWDVRLPLNIEDDDLDPSSRTPPKDRTGLTSFSYTLFTYWIMEKQRGFRLTQASQATAGDKSLLGCLADSMIDDLEAGLNENFLQYCDPINPLHAILQITARAVVNVLRLRKLHEARMRSQHSDDQCHVEHFNACMQGMRYIVVSHSNLQLKPFIWLVESSFLWYAFIGILVDMSNLADVNLIKSAWKLLSQLYAVADHLSDLEDDRRKSHAARSVVATWHECRQKPGLTEMQKPGFVTKLEKDLAELERKTIADVESQVGVPQEIWQTRPVETELQPFGFEFADIDWAFWDSIN